MFVDVPLVWSHVSLMFLSLGCKVWALFCLDVYVWDLKP